MLTAFGLVENYLEGIYDYKKKIWHTVTLFARGNYSYRVLNCNHWVQTSEVLIKLFQWKNWVKEKCNSKWNPTSNERLKPREQVVTS